MGKALKTTTTEESRSVYAWQGLLVALLLLKAATWITGVVAARHGELDGASYETNYHHERVIERFRSPGRVPPELRQRCFVRRTLVGILQLPPERGKERR